MSEEPRWQRPKVPSGTQTGNYFKVTILVDSEMPKEEGHQAGKCNWVEGRVKREV